MSVYTFNSNQDLHDNLRLGAELYDVVVPEDSMVKRLINERLLMPVEVGRMSNFRFVADRFRDPWFDPGRRFSAPYMWGTTGFLYDPAQVPDGADVESWKLFFDPPPELAGKVVAVDVQREVYAAAAFYLGLDPCTENPAEAQRILDVLVDQKRGLAYYHSTGDINFRAKAFSARRIAVYQVWNGAAHRVRELLPHLVYVYPKEGIHAWEDNLAVSASALHPKNAKVFINWMLDPKNIAEASNYNGYANAISDSAAYLNPELLDDPAVTPPAEYETRFRTVDICSHIAQQLSDKVWVRLWPRKKEYSK